MIMIPGCGSCDLSACWLAVLAAKGHVETLEVFMRTGEKMVTLRQPDDFRYKYQYAFIMFFKAGIKRWGGRGRGHSCRDLCGCCRSVPALLSAQGSSSPQRCAGVMWVKLESDHFGVHCGRGQSWAVCRESLSWCSSSAACRF